jgi:hypothetical protein
MAPLRSGYATSTLEMLWVCSCASCPDFDGDDPMRFEPAGEDKRS